MPPIDTHEEEQVEALKKWWAENGKMTIIGASLGFAILFGWRYWQAYEAQQAEVASLNYEQALMAKDMQNAVQLQQFSQNILNDSPDSPYAVFSSFLSAEQAVKAKQWDVANVHLQWAIDNGTMPALVDIAHLRLARVKVAEADYAAAEQQLAAIDNVQFIALKADVQGDIYWAQQRFDEAKAAYDTALGAINGLEGKHRLWVQNKRDQFGTAELKLVEAAALAQASTVE